jgi:haloalkane dehalogenase
MRLLRTDEDRFTLLAQFPFPPHYKEIPDFEGSFLRVHYLDEGPSDGPVVVLMHGEPSWCYLYRHMVPILAEAGCRVVAPDLVGFGRSDKPAEIADHTYARHVGWMTALLHDELDLRDATMVCQDWGGLIGLRLVAADPERYAGVVAANTGLPDGSFRMPEVWWRFHDFVMSTPDLPVGVLVRSGCVSELPEEVIAGYDAPFPGPDYKAGPRAMPGLIPQSAEDPETPAQLAAWEALGRFTKPVLMAFSDSDPITRGADAGLKARIPGTAGQPHTTIANAGHFLQEDQGPALAAVVADFVRSLQPGAH